MLLSLGHEFYEMCIIKLLRVCIAGELLVLMKVHVSLHMGVMYMQFTVIYGTGIMFM